MSHENRPPHAPGCNPQGLPHACTCGAATWKPTPPPPTLVEVAHEVEQEREEQEAAQ